MQAKDLSITNLTLLSEVFGNLDLLLETHLELVDSLSELFAALVGSTGLGGPLSPLIETVLLLTNVATAESLRLLLLEQATRDLNSLLVALEDVVAGLAIELGQTIDHLVLRR